MPQQTKKEPSRAAQKVPLARLNVISAIFQAVSWRFGPLWWNETSPPCIMLSTNVHPVFPASLSVSHPRIHSLRELPYCRSYPVSSGVHARNIRCVYSIFTTPISAPHRSHFKIKSGHHPIDGVTNCTFVSIFASMIRPPHSGHRTGRIRFFISCFHASFFLHISYTPLSYLFLFCFGGV